MKKIIPVLLGCLISPVSASVLSEQQAGKLAELALACINRPYPNKIAHVFNSDKDAKTPRKLYPAFYGCYDWHSSVHGHWLLVRLSRLFPESEFSDKALKALENNLSKSKLLAEAHYLTAEGNALFERPYGLAWLLQLAMELDEWRENPQAQTFRNHIKPLEEAAAGNLKAWIPKLAYPIRTGEHSQTAFAFGLILDWARQVGDSEMEAMLTASSLKLYAEDTQCPLTYEPSGQDFLSPCLAEADLMRRVMDKDRFSLWLDTFMTIPGPGGGDWLPVAMISDRSDGKLAHLDGLNISRAWMLEGIASHLAHHDPRTASLKAAAHSHKIAGLSAVTGEHYEGGHWLGSFATYLLSRRGIQETP